MNPMIIKYSMDIFWMWNGAMADAIIWTVLI